MDTTGEGGGEKERWFSVNICTQPSHVQDSNHVNNLNKTLQSVNNLNKTLLNESKLQRQNKPNTKAQLADSLKVCNKNDSHIICRTYCTK